MAQADLFLLNFEGNEEFKSDIQEIKTVATPIAEEQTVSLCTFASGHSVQEVSVTVQRTMNEIQTIQTFSYQKPEIQEIRTSALNGAVDGFQRSVYLVEATPKANFKLKYNDKTSENLVSGNSVSAFLRASNAAVKVSDSKQAPMHGW